MPQCEQQVLYHPFIVPTIITTHHFSRHDSFQNMETSTGTINSNCKSIETIDNGEKCSCSEEHRVKSRKKLTKCDISFSCESQDDQGFSSSCDVDSPNMMSRFNSDCSCKERSPSPGPMRMSPKRDSVSPRRSPSPFRRSPSPMGGSYSGYEQYQKSLLSVPLIPEYGDASSDDLSSEWDSDVPDVAPTPARTVHSKVGYGFL